MRLISSLLLCILLAAPVTAAPNERVREAVSLKVNGVRETWRLVWQGKPEPICGTDDIVGASTCPCAGWAYGEAGDLAVARTTPAGKVERVRLSPLFGRHDYPNADRTPQAIVPRWAIEDADYERSERGDPRLQEEIRRRSPPRLIHFADYDRDGQASEFLVHVENLPCGKRFFAAVGVSKANPRLHVLGSAAHPEEPLIMRLPAWQALLRSRTPTEVVTWECDDHGSEVRTVMTVSAEAGRIHAVERALGCRSMGTAGKLMSVRVW
jgi:hypothetical protein